MNESLKNAVKVSIRTCTQYLLTQDLNTTILGDRYRLVELLKEGWELKGTFHNGTGYYYYLLDKENLINSFLSYMSKFFEINAEKIELIQVSFTEHFSKDDYQSEELKVSLQVYGEQFENYIVKDEYAKDVKKFLTIMLGLKQDKASMIRNIEREYTVDTLKSANYKYELLGIDKGVRAYYPDSKEYAVIKPCNDTRFGYFIIEGKVQSLNEWISRSIIDMTGKERLQIAGRFEKVNDSPIIVGVIGTVNINDLSEEQVKYIKGFYQSGDKAHSLTEEYPAEFGELSDKSHKFNGFIIIKD